MFLRLNATMRYCHLHHVEKGILQPVSSLSKRSERSARVESSKGRKRLHLVKVHHCYPNEGAIEFSLESERTIRRFVRKYKSRQDGGSSLPVSANS